MPQSHCDMLGVIVSGLVVSEEGEAGCGWGGVEAEVGTKLVLVDFYMRRDR